MVGCHVQPEQAFNLIFGYNDRWFEDASGTQSGAGTYSSYSTAVPAGEVWVLQAASLRNATGARGRMHIRVYDNSNYVDLAYDATPAQNEPLMWSGAIVLKDGDRARVLQTLCLDNDVMYGGFWGYKMKVTQ